MRNLYIAWNARKLVIDIGKVLPFIVCGVVIISYVESLFSLALSNYLYYDGTMILDTPLSFLVGQIFEYDVIMFAIMLVLGLAIEACRWNILTTLYLGIHLLEKSYFDFELTPFCIYLIIISNLIVSCYLVYRGIKALMG